MKRILFLSMLITFLILVSQMAFADGLQMLTQTYHTKHKTSTDGTPVIEEVYEEWEEDYHGDPGLTYTYESVSMFDVKTEADIIKSNWIQPHCYAHASGDWHFTPLYDNLLIDFDVIKNHIGPTYFFETTITLKDITASVDLINIEVGGGSFFIIDPHTYEFVADPSHEYELIIEIYDQVCDIGYSSLNIKASVDSFSVPEPSTLLLVLFGLMGLAGMKRRI